MRKINIKCCECGEDFIIEPYFSNVSLIRCEELNTLREYHKARTIANAICPRCGERNAEVCETDVFRDEIIELAIRRHKREV